MNELRLPRSLTDTIADWLVDQMNQDLLKPGQQLNIDALARQFGVSQTPIREALKSLQAEKLVDYPFHSSPRVAELTRQTLADLYICRAHLRGLAVRLAVVNLDPDKLLELQQLVERMKETVEHADVQAYFVLSSQFDETVVRIADNEVLKDLLHSLRRRSLHPRYLSIASPARLKAGLAFHRQMLDAFRNADGELAEELMVNHIRRALDVLLENDTPSA